MASDQESISAGNRRREENQPPREREQRRREENQPPREQEVPAIGAHHAPPLEAPLQEIVDPEAAVLPPFHPSVSLELEAADKFPPVFVFEKMLSSADVSRELGFQRLYIKNGWRLPLCLKVEEMQSLELGNDIRVLAADPNAIQYDLWLSAGRGRAVAPPMDFVFGGEWTGVVDKNGLKEGDKVEGWGFRVQGLFRLALHIIKQEFASAGNRRLEENQPPREQEVLAIGAHHAPPLEAPLQEIVDPEAAVLPPFHLSVSLELEAADNFPPVLVFEKGLKSSDVTGAIRFRRLFISEGQRLSHALNAEEKQSVEGDGLSVRAADPNAFHYDLLLTAAGHRPMEFNVRGEWMEVVKKNRLKKGDRLEGWGFRVQGMFRLALRIIK